MSRFVDIRKIGIALVIGIMLVTALVPVCQMVSCSMVHSAMPGAPLTSLSAACGGLAGGALGSGIVAENTLTSLFALCAAMVLAVAFGAPTVRLGMVRANPGRPSSPLRDPRGVRLIV